MDKGKPVYMFDSSGFYAGEGLDYGGPLPHSSTLTKPSVRDGYIPRWNGKAWEQIENHKGEKGFIGGKRTVIDDYGPLPKGWSEEYIDPRPPEEIRKSEILARLSILDSKKVRPISAILAGSGTDEDKSMLQELESEATNLRDELATL